MADRLDSGKIKTALAIVHHREKSDGPREAAKHASHIVGLSKSEQETLFRCLNLGWGKTGTRRKDLHCSECGGSGFAYNNGHEFSEDGVRGYRCLTCQAIKPERAA